MPASSDSSSSSRSIAWFSGSLSLFKDSRSGTFIAAGGVTAALTVALLVAGLGSQTFYPREGSVGMWCAIGLMFRVSVERRKALAAAQQAPPEEAPVRLRPVPIARPTMSRVRSRASATRRASLKSLNLDSFLWKAAA